MSKWTAAVKKCREEGRCRNCGSRDGLETCHVIARSIGGKMKPESVLPLCFRCHRLQHEHRLEILPLLTLDEQLEAVRVVGSARAYALLTRGGE